MVTHFSQEKWNNGEWAPTGEKGGRTVQKEKDAQTTLRLFDTHRITSCYTYLKLYTQLVCMHI